MLPNKARRILTLDARYGVRIVTDTPYHMTDITLQDHMMQILVSGHIIYISHYFTDILLYVAPPFPIP